MQFNAFSFTSVMDVSVYKLGSEMQTEKYPFMKKTVLLRARTVVLSHTQPTSHAMIHNLKETENKDYVY